MENKIQYIYNSIYKNDVNKSIIYKFIVDNNLNYTENKNGYFLNLSKLEDTIINKLYKIVNYNNLEDKEYINDDLYTNKNNESQINININNKKTYKNKYTKLNIDDKIDLYLLDLSKNK